MTTIVDLETACAAQTVLDLGRHPVNRYQITAVAACTDRRCPIGAGCVAVVDLRLVGNPAVVLANCHVADTHTLPTAA